MYRFHYQFRTEVGRAKFYDTKKETVNEVIKFIFPKALNRTNAGPRLFPGKTSKIFKVHEEMKRQTQRIFGTV